MNNQESRELATANQKLEQALVIMQKTDEKIGRLLDLVREYQRLVNSYHECYPHPEDLEPFKIDLEQRSLEFGL